jgi:pterin-4a-carbinolamine dehydratase
VQVKEFNNSIYDANPDITLLGISKDLPFAQSRFCTLHNIKNLILLSDYKYGSFGINYGLLVKEINLLARAVIIIDKNDVIRYIQVADEIRHELDFSKILEEIIKVTENPNEKPEDKKEFKIDKAENLELFNKDQIDKLMAKFPEWQIENGSEISKSYKFKNFSDAKFFIDIIAVIAEEQNHHPDIYNSYNKVKINFTTHKKKGLTQNDFSMAAIVDEIVL